MNEQLAIKPIICKKKIHLFQDFFLPLCDRQLPGIVTFLGEVKAVEEILFVLLRAAENEDECKLEENIFLTCAG